MQDVSDAVDASLGSETFEFRPMKKLTVNDPPTTDDARSTRTIIGLWGGPAQDLDLDQDRPVRTRVYGGDGKMRVSSLSPRLSIDVRQFLADEMPRVSDHFARAATNDVYIVTDVQPDNQGRTIYVLSHINREAA